MGGAAWMTFATRDWRIERSGSAPVSRPSFGGQFPRVERSSRLVRRGPVVNAVRQDEFEAAPSLLEGRLRMRPETERQWVGRVRAAGRSASRHGRDGRGSQAAGQ